jgi:hypothetical protein
MMVYYYKIMQLESAICKVGKSDMSKLISVKKTIQVIKFSLILFIFCKLETLVIFELLSGLRCMKLNTSLPT